jgi:hypothetical protein
MGRLFLSGLLVVAGCKSESTGIACVADNICQPACAADPDCAASASTWNLTKPLLCGRYVVEDEGAGRIGSGTGLILDTATGLKWLRFDGPGGRIHKETGAFCAAKGMRLPTKTEAVAIASHGREKWCEAAWPKGWWTWTTTTAGEGRAWYVDYVGDVGHDPVDGENRYSGLCVR